MLKIDKINLHKSLNENNLKQNLTNLGMNTFKELEEINLFKLEAPLICYSENDVFFYAQLDNDENFDPKLHLAFKKEIIIINAPFCLIVKKDKFSHINLYYKGKIHKQEDINCYEKIKEAVLHYDDYYLGYEKRYKKVYENGGNTWESILPNESLVAIYTHFREYFIDKKVIDLGCGEGRDCIFLSKNGINVLGVDISHTALQKARILAKNQKLNIDFLELNILYLNGLNDESFDAAINMGAFI